MNTEYLEELARIRSNAKEALDHATQDKMLAAKQPDSEGHFLLIEQIFQNQLHVLRHAELLAHDSLPSEQLTYASIWLDIQFWISKLGCFYERTSLMIKRSASVTDLVSDEFSSRANSIIGLSIILARFTEIACATTPPLTWIQDEQLMRCLVDIEKSIYIRIFSTLEELITSSYATLISNGKICKAETELTELLKLCEQIPCDVLKKDSKLTESASILEKIQLKIKKMASNEHVPFARIIRHVTDNYLSKENRKADLPFWTFFFHARNSLLHKKGLGTCDCAIELWGRDYKIEKDKPFGLFKDGSFIILSFKLIEIFVDLMLQISEEESLLPEWAEIKKKYLTIGIPTLVS
jgi:hypothetical protein